MKRDKKYDELMNKLMAIKLNIDTAQQWLKTHKEQLTHANFELVKAHIDDNINNYTKMGLQILLYIQPESEKSLIQLN